MNWKIPYHYQDKVKEELRKLEDTRVIEAVPQEEPTIWIISAGHTTEEDRGSDFRLHGHEET